MNEFTNFIVHLLRRPKMFFIQKVDDFYFMVNGYIAGKEKDEYSAFMDGFSRYLSKKYNFKEDTPYPLIIKSMSIYDSVNLDFLKNEIYYFFNSEEIKRAEFWKSISGEELTSVSLLITPSNSDL